MIPEDSGRLMVRKAEPGDARPALSDTDLVRAARGGAGSEEAREAACALLSRYRERVYLWCYRYVLDHDRALDLSQDALLSAYRNLSGFEGRSAFSSWLYAITRNRCISELRRPGLLRDEDVDPDSLGGTAKDPEEDFLERAGEEEIRTLIRDHLDPDEQTALWLRCIERLPVDSITSLLGIGQASGARGVLQQARRKLRAALRERGAVPAQEGARRTEARAPRTPRRTRR